MPRRATAIEVPRSGNSQRRILFVTLILVVWMLAVGARLVQLQISRHDELATRARNQQLSSIETAPTRGQVLDRQGRELARSLDTESFYSDPSEVNNVEETARKIATITGLDRADLVRKFNEARSEERRVGKECRSRGAPDHLKKKTVQVDESSRRRAQSRHSGHDMGSGGEA